MAINREQGMTLIELMIVVAIIGILSAVAVFMFSRSTAKARASEVPAMFAEFRIKQESFHLENGTYLSTGADETDFYPPTGPATSASGPIDLSTIAVDPEWQQLRINSDKNSLYCNYVNIAGPAGATPSQAQAVAFNFNAVQNVNWFYMLAQCDLDSDSSQYSVYFARSGAGGQAVQNPGK